MRQHLPEHKLPRLRLQKPAGCGLASERQGQTSTNYQQQKVIDNLEMNRLREDGISGKEEEKQREDARAARGSQRGPVVVVG